ncbi:carboxymuconolactone decarboxylase family protein [Cryobacterium sp. BB736]|uniref:carboxymuconolactone decarboxylase family protein n=1 Tax=Cryobacterium sp. BB736 TaxID=2746963 RepID=UPI001874CF71|nr:carboxymuconolactone decarboxylase family protein [Cryobacterium sp. BB736]
MARIPLDHPRTLKVRFMEAYSKRKYGGVLDPGLVAYHNPKVLSTMIRHESSVAKWDALDPTLKALATMASASEIGCSWCMDFGFWEANNQGVDQAKLRAVPNWQASDVYTPLERRVMEYSVAMTQTPPTVTDEMVDALRSDLSDPELVELTAIIALENQRSRTNAAMGLTSQGFKDQCELRPM